MKESVSNQVFSQQQETQTASGLPKRALRNMALNIKGKFKTPGTLVEANIEDEAIDLRLHATEDSDSDCDSVDSTDEGEGEQTANNAKTSFEEETDARRHISRISTLHRRTGSDKQPRNII